MVRSLEKAAMEAMAPGTPAEQTQSDAQTNTQPVSSVNILGRSVRVTYSDRTSDAERLAASSLISSSVELINKNADNLTKGEKATIGNIKEINVDPNASRSSVDVKTGTYHANADHLKQDVARFTTDLFHDGAHINQWRSGHSYTGAEAEARATRFQIDVGRKIGLSESNIKILEDYANHIQEYQNYWNSQITH